MKTSIQNKSSGLIRYLLAILALALLGMFTIPANSEAAGTAGNAVVRNKVTVTYKDLNNNDMPALYAAIDIKLNAVAAAPKVYAFAPAAGTTGGLGLTQQYNVTVITNSNGPGTIALTAATDITAAGAHQPVNFTSLGTAAAFVANSGTYGATTIAPGSAGIGAVLSVANTASVTFTVPFDSTQADSATTINSLIAGRIVYVYSGTAYYGPFTVGTVTNGVRNGTPDGTGTTTDVSAVAGGTIQLTNNTGSAITSAGNVAAGWQIVEAKTLTNAVTVTQGTVTNAALAASWWTTVTATMGGLDGSDDVRTDASLGMLNIKKYVRNITTAGSNTGAAAFTTAAAAPAPLDGADFYGAGAVTAVPTEKLEYLIIVENAGLGTVNSVQATDTIPAFTTLYEGASYGSGSGTVFARVARYTGAAWTSSADTLVAAGGTTANVAYGITTGTAAGSTTTFNLGQGAVAGAAGGGSLAPGDIVYIIFQVTVN